MINIRKVFKFNHFFMPLAVFYAVFIYFLNIRFMGFGIDFTDEGFYLNWISNPFSFEYGLTNFGFFYYPFFSLFNENIVYLRWFNVFLIGSLSYIVSFLALSKVANLVFFKEKALLSFALSSLGLSLYSGNLLFIPTPSYNDLNFVGLLVVLVGWLIGLEARKTSLIFASSFFIALGGLFLFHAKTSTALLVGLTMLLVMLIHSDRKALWISITIGMFFVLVILTSFYISSGPLELIQRFITAYEIQSYLKSGHDFLSLIRVDDFSLGKRLSFYLFLAFAFLTSYFYLDKRGSSLIWHELILFILVGFISYYIFSGQIFEVGYYQGVFLLLLSLAPLMYFYTLGSLQGLRSGVSIKLLTLLSIVLVYSYAFGTNNNYFVMYNKVFLFLALISTVILRKHIGLRSTLVFIICLQIILILNLLKSFETPYRQPQPLSNNDSLTNVHNSKLMLENGFSTYIKELEILKSKSSAKNFIDFSGQMPTLAYVLNLDPVGVAWIIGGYPGSDEFAYQVLKQAGCNRFENAILLHEPAGPRSINIKVLSNFGLDLERDFELAYEATSPVGAGGYVETRKQFFYYSKSENVKKHCNTN